MASDGIWNKHQNSQNESLKGDESRPEKQTQFRFQFLPKLLFSQLQWCFHLWTFPYGAKQGSQTLLILYTKWDLFSMEPRYNKGLRDWQNLFAILRFFFICRLLGWRKSFAILRTLSYNVSLQSFCNLNFQKKQHLPVRQVKNKNH